MRKCIYVAVVFCITISHLSAQENSSLRELKHFLQNRKDIAVDSSNPFLSMFQNGYLNYLSPIYKAIIVEKKLLELHGYEGYYDDLAQAVSFAGDYKSAIEFNNKANYPIDDSIKTRINAELNSYKDVQYVDAEKYIISQAASHKIIMINEAHSKPLHRAFTASLLEDLYKTGYRYLAMETLNPFKNHSLRKLNTQTGYYTCEPVGGEMIRKALELGFTPVPYEDTSATALTPNQRDSLQAVHIYTIFKNDPGAKVIVHAGYGHIEETALSPDRIPMAVYFKKISGMDPLTIDQTEMTEGSNSDYGRTLYEGYIKKYHINSTVVPIRKNEPLHFLDEKLFDVYVIHPPTKYSNGRPVWLSMNGIKKEVPVQPVYQTLFMVQAYYDNEYNNKYLGRLIPADQTYVSSDNGFYYIYLTKGKYRLVYRDMEYKILGTKAITVDE